MRKSNAQFPPSVAVFRCRFAVPVRRCRFRTPLPLPLPLCISRPMRWLVSVDDWLTSYGTKRRKKIELDPVSTVERLR